MLLLHGNEVDVEITLAHLLFELRVCKLRHSLRKDLDGLCVCQLGSEAHERITRLLKLPDLALITCILQHDPSLCDSLVGDVG